jgi:hypothetical protein
MLKLKFLGKEHRITLTIDSYVWDKSFALTMQEIEDGYPMPWGTITVRLDDYPCEGNRQFVDTNNNGEEIVNWLIENNLGTPTGRIGYSGYCQYPEFEFNIDEINKHLTEDALI